MLDIPRKSPWPPPLRRVASDDVTKGLPEVYGWDTIVGTAVDTSSRDPERRDVRGRPPEGAGIGIRSDEFATASNDYADGSTNWGGAQDGCAHRNPALSVRVYLSWTGC